MTYRRCEISSAMVSFCSTSRIDTPRLRDLLEQPRDQLDDLRRQALGRLVDHHQVGIAHQRAAQRQHLLLAAGQHAGRRVGALAQHREQLEHVVEAPAALLVRAFMPSSRFWRTVSVGKDVAVLRHVAEAAARDRVGLQAGELLGP